MNKSGSKSVESILFDKSDGWGGLSSSVVKALLIVENLAVLGDSGAPLGDISIKLNIPKSTTHRYLTTLQKLGYVERVGSDFYRLGTKIIELAGILLSKSDLREASQPTLEDLSSLTNETIHLAVPSGLEVVYISKVESQYPIRMYSYIGARLPMASTSLGRSILAFTPKSRVEEVIANGLVKMTTNTIETPEDFLLEIEHVRNQGFAVDNEENEIGVNCVGAPIFDYTQGVVAAISISGPTSRMDKNKCIELGPTVKEAALAISRRLGYFNGSTK